MKICAVIAEYNPLHLGHVRHLAHAKALGDALIVVQNGDFCQRGQDCVLDAYTRARHAIEAGADIVVQMPTVFGLNCADKFAMGGTRMLLSLPHSVILSFGSECGDIATLQNTAYLLQEEPDEVKQQIKDLLSLGVAYPIARANAVRNYAARHSITICDLDKPNNILALEYIRHGAGLSFDTIQREDNYKDSNDALSSTAIRSMLAKGESNYRILAPDYVCMDLQRATQSQDVLYLAAMRALPDNFELYDAKEGLQNRVLQAAQRANDYASAVSLASTKRYTTARLTRLFAYALLGMDSQTVSRCMTQASYYNVLAVRRDKTNLLGILAEGGKVYTSMSQLKQSGESEQLDAKAHEIYRTLHQNSIPTALQLI